LSADYLLIVANSARMLTQAAQLTGFKALVIDCFADLDTQFYADDYQQVLDLSIVQEKQKSKKTIKTNANEQQKKKPMKRKN
jgi:predicted ATP-grasp superfamily ATP-dependent carboligase